MRPVFVTALVIVAAGIVRTYDLVVAMTGGGPGTLVAVSRRSTSTNSCSSPISAQGLAASTVLLVTVAIIVVPWAYYEFGRRRTQ